VKHETAWERRPLMSSSAMRVHSSAACASAEVTLCVLLWSADAYLLGPDDDADADDDAMAPAVIPSTAATWKPGQARSLRRRRNLAAAKRDQGIKYQRLVGE
jgi:hypothetical protein